MGRTNSATLALQLARDPEERPNVGTSGLVTAR